MAKNHGNFTSSITSAASQSPSSSNLSQISLDLDVLEVVKAQGPPRRRAAQAHKASCSHNISQDDIQRIMEEYHGLTEECLDQHDATAPQVLAANQALLAEKVRAIQHSRGFPASAMQTHRERSGDLEAGTPAVAVPHSELIAGSPSDDSSSSSSDDSSNGEGLSGPAEWLDTQDGNDADTGAAAEPVGTGNQQRHPRKPYFAEYTFMTYGMEERQHSVKVEGIRLDNTPRLPEYFSWSEMPRSKLAADMPPGTKLFYPDQEGETVAINDPEIESKPWFDAYGFTHDYALRKLAAAYNDKLEWVLRAVAAGLRQEDEDVHVSSSDLAERVVYLWQQEHKPAPPTDSGRRRAAFTESTEFLHKQFCNRCQVYACPQHGGGHVLPSKCPPPQPAGAPSPQPCSNTCWRRSAALNAAAQSAGAVDMTAIGQENGSVHSAEALGGAAAADLRASGLSSQPAQHSIVADAGDSRQQERLPEQEHQPHGSKVPSVPQLSAYEEGMLHEGLSTFGPDACKLALLLLDQTCCDLQLLLQRRGLLNKQPRIEEEAAPEEQPAAKRRKRRGGAARRHVQEQRWRSGEHHAEPPYQPCTCVGPCQKGSCSCIDNATFCEKFCACVGCKTQRDCTFQGCGCSTGCRIATCPCSKANRECDPDLCKNCTAAAAGSALPDSCCGNMNIRLNRHKRVQLGLSTIAGWGSFIAEPACKGEFIGEYVGELLTQEEADRRGAAYDKSDNSYLFTINTQWVLDARQSGNELRFANHSSRPNCRTRVMMVDGDHRVGLYAEQDLEAGEELFYNYMYALDNAPDWAVAA